MATSRDTAAMRWICLTVLVAVGCGRTGIGSADGSNGGGYFCGPGTHVSGAECVPDADAGVGVDGGGAGGGGDAGSDGGPLAPDLGPPPPPPIGSAVAYQIDPAHSGGQPGSGLRPPLGRRWSKTLDGTSLTYPLIVGDSVFVIASGGTGSRLYALSAATGDSLWAPVTIATNASNRSYPAWDANRLFVADSSGPVHAFDASSGARLWSHSFGKFDAPDAPPVAAAGMVYVVVGGTLYALSEDTGAIRWQQGGGGHSTSPAWTPTAVVLEYIGRCMSAFAPSGGAVLWRTGCDIVGSGGDTPVVYQDRVYSFDFWNYWNRTNDIDSLADGTRLGTFTSLTQPAFENGLGFFRGGSTVEGHDRDGHVLWSFAGDGMLDSTPIAAGGYVYLGSSTGMLYALDEVTGRQVWSDVLPAAVAPSQDPTKLPYPVTGVAASSDLLVVPAGSTLTAYGNNE